jgi:PAS domain S-box-containing protein
VALPDYIYRAAFDQPATPLAVVDNRGLLALWNSSFESTFRLLAGTGPESLRGSFFELVAERGGQRLDYFASELLLGGRGSAHMESVIVAADGSRHWLRFALSRIEAPALAGGAAPDLYILCSIEDVSDRVVREARLTEAKEEAEKATQTKSLFLANMSHEIRTPIQTILSVVELLQGTSLDTEQSEYAKQVRFSADVLLALINDILDFSKIEAGKLELEMADFDLRACLYQSADLLVLDAHRKGLEVLVDVDDNLPSLVRGDQARVRQVLVNLFKNAVKFTKEGSISLVLRQARARGGTIMRFEVQDTGVGIPADVRSRLFTAFYQGDAAAARKAGGTGLGLAISRNLVELMGGSIGVSPNEVHGSVFWFELPLAAPDFSRPPRPAPAPARARLLVVDDHPGARAFAARSARAAGYAVSEASSGTEALDALHDAAALGEPFELCLIDQNMPHMDGWRLASEITGDTAINGARLILMVPEGTMGGDAKMKLLRWFNAYVSKPVRPTLLLETLAKALSSDVDLEDAEGAGEEESQPKAEASFPCHLLLAEDHEVNRELFTLLLSRLGCDVTAAQDGQEAVELVQASLEGGKDQGGQSFDIVLMDIFMPRMNGYDAAAALRRRGYKGPIIAVTASALKGEREKCIKVGMNDVLIKPFKRDDLEALLSTWLPHLAPAPAASRARGQGGSGDPGGGLLPLAGEAAQGAATAGRPDKAKDACGEGASAQAVFDWEGVLDTFLGKKETVVSLLGRFSAKAKEQVGELERALEAGDFNQFREVAHSMKGASWNLSARCLGDAALAAEMAGKSQDGKAAAEAYVAVTKAVEDFLCAVAPFVGTQAG